MKLKRLLTPLLLTVVLMGYVRLASSQASFGTPFGWGNTNDGGLNFVGQSIPPLIPSLELPNVSAISAGGDHSLALLSDGTIVAWGDNGSGQSTVPANLSNIVAVAAGYFHSLALKSDGTVSAWGDNSTGEINVPPGLSNVIAISAGGCSCLPSGNQSLALKSDGTVVGWGATTVPLGLSNVVAISAGNNHGLALLADGTLRGWGLNANGQASSPPGLSNVVAVSAGGYHSLALTTEGTVIAWGNNYYGQAEVPAGLSNVASIAAGENFSLARLSNGTIVGWGDNIFGETSIPNGLSNVISVAAGRGHALVLLNGSSPFVVREPQDESAYSGQAATLIAAVAGSVPLSLQWRHKGIDLTNATNTFLTLTNSQLSDNGDYDLVVTNNFGSVTSTIAHLSVMTSSPIILTQPTTLNSSFGASADFTVKVTGSLPNDFQWQFNGTHIIGATNSLLALTNLQLGDAGLYRVTVSNAFGIGISSNASLTVSLVALWGDQPNTAPVLTNIVAIDRGECSAHDLAIKNDGSLVAWGANVRGQTSVPPGLSNVVMVATGLSHTLALTRGGTVTAWGSGSVTNIGPAPNYLQSRVPPGLSNVVAIAAGEYHSLALKKDGTVVGWGSTGPYNYGQTNIPPGLTNVLAIAAGDFHSVALKRDGKVIAWGNNDNGQTQVPNGLSNVVAVAAGRGHTLALKDDGKIVGWGWNLYGQVSIPPGLTNVVAIAAGYFHSLALQSNGKVTAWGGNDAGQTNVPVELTNVVDLTGGYYHSLALIVPSPYFLRHPISQTALRGTAIVLKAAVMGVPPLNYQWRFNGTNIPDGTNSLLTLSNVQDANAGDYDLWVSNNYGARVSDMATLTVVFPPSITAQPQNRTVVAGGVFNLNVGADGTPPLNYQWRFNGTNINGATNGSFSSIANTNNAGNYLTVIANPYGSVTSSPAKLTVFLPPQNFSATMHLTSVQLHFNGTPGYPYVLQAATNLQPPIDWLPLITNTADNIGNWTFTDTNAALVPTRFFRVTTP